MPEPSPSPNQIGPGSNPGRRYLRRLAQLVAAIAVSFVGLVAVGAVPASAHATLVSSAPADGANLDVSPAQVSITFDESVGLQPGYLRVIDSAGRRVDTGSAFHPAGHDDVVVVDLKPKLPTAAYIASYRVVSADSHPVGGVVRFTVGGASLASVASVASGTSTDGTVTLVLDVARSVSFIGLAVGGGWWLALFIAGADERGMPWPRASRRVVATGMGLAFLGAFVELILQGPYAAGTGLSSLGQGTLLADTVGSSFGYWHLAQLVLLAVLTVLVVSPVHIDAADYRRTGWALSSGLWLAVLICVAATGHAAVRTPVWLGELSTVVHLASMTTWVGGLALLGTSVLSARSGDPGAALRALPVFSAVATVCVGALAATGTYQAYREVGGWHALVDTEYGALILVKIGLFVVLIGLGYLARGRVRRLVAANLDEFPDEDEFPDDDEFPDEEFGDDDEFTDEDARPLRRLRIGVLVEVAIAVAVLSATGVLVAQRPASEAAASAVESSTGTRTVALSATRTLSLTVTPARPGSVTIALYVSAGPEVQKMTLAAQLPSASIGPIPVPVTSLDAQRFTTTAVTLPVAGQWQFTVTVQTSAFDIVSAVVPITLV